MKNKTIICIQCGNEFIVTPSEQKRCIERKFDMPKRCPECRKHKAKIKQQEEWRKKGKHRRLKEEPFD
jgi:Zn finger protein HypA/HybF involved in hydrogenase expression